MAKKAKSVINNTVRVGSELFLAGNEDHAERLVDVLNARSCKRLLEANAISGDAFEEKAKAASVETDADLTESTAAATAKEQALPDGFPHRMSLISNGLDTMDKVRAATDEQLMAIKGVGEATVSDIRTALE